MNMAMTAMGHELETLSAAPVAHGPRPHRIGDYSPFENVNPVALLPDNDVAEVEPPPIRTFVIDA